MEARVSALDIALRLVGPHQLALAQAIGRKTGQPLFLVLLDLELVDENRLADEIASALHLHRFQADSAEYELAARLTLDREFARDHLCCPICFEAGHLVLAMVDPLDQETVEQAEELSGYPVRVLVATPGDLEIAYAAWPEGDRPMVDPASMPTVDRTRLAIPTVVFLGYPDGVGATFVVLSLAAIIGRERGVLLLSIGGPADEEDELQRLGELRAYLDIVPDAALVPDRLQDLSEAAEAGHGPRLDIALAEIDHATFIVDAEQVAQWATTLVLVTDAEHAGVSWELVRRMYAADPYRKGISVGIIVNKVSSREHAEAGMAAVEAVVRSTELPGPVRVWIAGSLPFDPGAIQDAERQQRMLVDALPRHRLSRSLREIAGRIIDEVEGAR